MHSGAVGAVSSQAHGATVAPTLISSEFLSRSTSEERLWLVVLNHTLPHVTRQLWDRAHYKVCADGGANRLFDELPALAGGSPADGVRDAYVPDRVIGDMDSLRADVRAFYASRGTVFDDLSHDQDSTDLEKCLRHLQHQMVALQSTRSSANGGGCPKTRDIVVALAAIGGRLDHTLSNLNALYGRADTQIVLIGEGNVVRLLPRGRSIIRINAAAEGTYCGVVPMGGPARVSSQGLRWDMDNLELQWAGMLSTSNQLTGSHVEVECDHPCLWMTELGGA